MENQAKQYSMKEIITKGAANAVNIINGSIKFYRLYENIEYGIKLFAG